MACLCDKIKGSDLKEKVRIRQRTTTAGTYGTHTETTTDHVEWAKVRPFGGRERFDQMRMRPGEGFRITIRFRGDTNGNPFYTIDDRVILRTQELAIESVVDIEDAHRWIELVCVANKAT